MSLTEHCTAFTHRCHVEAVFGSGNGVLLLLFLLLRSFFLFSLIFPRVCVRASAGVIYAVRDQKKKLQKIFRSDI